MRYFCVLVCVLCLSIGSLNAETQERPRGFWMTPKQTPQGVQETIETATSALVFSQSQVFVLEAEASFLVDFGPLGQDINDRVVARAFFERHPDTFDTLVLWTSFPVALAGGNAAGLYIPVSSSVRGLNIGLDGRYPEEFDFTEQYGSQSRLRGVILMGDVTAMPSWARDPSYNRGLSVLGVLGQETLHQFGAFVGYVHDGQYRRDLVGRGDAHWSFFFHSAGSDLEGNRWVRNSAGGEFVSGPVGGRFNDLDLYLMGWLAPEEVLEDLFLLQETTPIVPDNASRRSAPVEGGRVRGEPLPITVDMIIDAHGPRLPTSRDSPRVLRQAFVLVVDPSQSDEERENALQKLEMFRREWTSYAYEAARFKGRMNTHQSGLEDFVHWRFGGSLEGWQAREASAVREESGVVLEALVKGSEMMFVQSALDAPADSVDWLEVSLRTESVPDAPCALEMSVVAVWEHRVEGRIESSQSAWVATDGARHTYTFSLADGPKEGVLRELRLVWGEGVTRVVLEKVEGVSPVTRPDRDRDGVWDMWDNCPARANAVQYDTDRDSVGDACSGQGEVCRWPPEEDKPRDEGCWCRVSWGGGVGRRGAVFWVLLGLGIWGAGRRRGRQKN